MRYLFVHQNSPGQFKYLAPRLAAEPGNQVVFLTQKDRRPVPGVQKVEYEPHRMVTKDIHRYVRSTEEAAIYAQGAARVAIALKEKGFAPDTIIGHPGWGETLLLKEVFPDARIVHFCEFYYSPRGADVGFDPEFPSTLDSKMALVFRNAPHLMALEMADACYAPTEWQKAQFPATYRDRISVIHDGIDCAYVHPDPQAVLEIEGHGRFAAAQKIVTYVARNLEPYRGFHTFARMLPHLFAQEPDVQVIVVGGDEVSYGQRLPEGQTYRARYMAEIEVPADRVHFLGKISFAEYTKVLQVSAAHVYLTYPFVLSWSCLEAMAAGCLMVASDTQPVQEVITDGENGMLTGFFDPQALAARVVEGLRHPERFAGMRRRARETVLARYDLNDCINRQLQLIRG